MIKLRIHGAAGTVTGSMHELYTDDGELRVLIDCGAFQGEDEQNKEASFPFDPSTVTHVLLTHAHLDHCGRLPELVRAGFCGTVISTRMTLRLARASLKDAVHLTDSFSEEDVRKLFGNAAVALGEGGSHTKSSPRWFVDRTCYSKPMPLYEFAEERRPTIFYRMLRSSHLLGAVGFQLNWNQSNGEDRHDIVFFGDSGPEMPNSDVLTGLICAKNFNYAPPYGRDASSEITVVAESTYGDREMQPSSRHERLERLEDLLVRVSKKGKRLLIPTFSLGRTQNLLFDIATLRDRNPALRMLPVFAPPKGTLADKASQIYVEEVARAEMVHRGANSTDVRVSYANRKVWKDLGIDVTSVEGEKSARTFMRAAFGLKSVPEFPTVKRLDSQATLDELPRGSVIVASSGMGVGGVSGRLLPEFARAANTVLGIVGYATPKTPVGQLRQIGQLPPEQRRRLRSQKLQFADDRSISIASVKTEVVELTGYSGHASRDGITELVLPLEDSKGPEIRNWPSRVLLVHGSKSARQGQRDLLQARCDEYVSDRRPVELALPKEGESFVLDSEEHLARDW